MYNLWITLSVTDALFGSSIPEGGGEKEERDDQEPDGLVGGSAGTTNSNSAESIHHQQGQGTGGCNTPVQPRTASIRARPTSSRITAAELEELFQRQQGCSSGNSQLCYWGKIWGCHSSNIAEDFLDVVPCHWSFSA